MRIVKGGVKRKVLCKYPPENNSFVFFKVYVQILECITGRLNKYAPSKMQYFFLYPKLLKFFSTKNIEMPKKCLVIIPHIIF